MSNITPEIENFNRGFNALKNATSQLDEIVIPLLKDAGESFLVDLIEILPMEYQGLRKIYDALEHAPSRGDTEEGLESQVDTASLEPRIREFRKAFKEMKEASKKLDAVVSPLMKDATEPALKSLAEILPKDYRNVRRVYHAILEIREKAAEAANSSEQANA